MIIGNEIRFVDKLLKGVVKGESNYKEMNLLARNYLNQGLTTEEIKPMLNDWYDGYESEREFMVNIALENAVKNPHMNEVESITITRKEWKYVQAVGRNERERKVLFTLLCQYKIKSSIYMDNNYMKVEYTKLSTQAHTTFTKANRLDAFRYFEEIGAITLKMGARAEALTINFVDREEDSEPYVVIEDFESLHIYYEYLKSNKSKRIYRCKDCGLMALKERGKQYNSKKYCDACSEKRKAEQNRNRKKKQDDRA